MVVRVGLLRIGDEDLTILVDRRAQRFLKRFGIRVAAAPEATGEGLCAKESKAKPTMATIVRSVIFMTAFLVEVLPLRFTSVLHLAQPFR